MKGTVVREIALKNIRWFSRKGELSFYIGKDYQNKGYAGEALKIFLEHVFNRLNLYRLEAEAYEYNNPSIKLLEKAGFVFEGRAREAKFSNRKYIDILRYGLLKKEYMITKKSF